MDNKSNSHPLAMRLFDTKGQRLYCNAEERALFLNAARKYPPHMMAIAEVLHNTGLVSLSY